MLEEDVRYRQWGIQDENVGCRKLGGGFENIYTCGSTEFGSVDECK